MHRKFKQLVYFLFYALCWGALIAGVYFLLLKPAPSCFDGKQNQGEEGIDCGGPCALVCIPKTIKPIVVVDRVVWLESGTNNYVAFAAVKNDNVNFAAKSFDYAFSLYDDTGRVVGTQTGHSFMYAGDVRYLFAPNIPSGFSIAKATLDISNVDWVKPGVFQKPRLRVQDFTTTHPGTSYSVDGHVVNEDTIPFDKVIVIAVFRGTLGQFGGVSQTTLDNVLPNETRKFTVFYPAVTQIDPTATQVYVYAEHP